MAGYYRELMAASMDAISSTEWATDDNVVRLGWQTVIAVSVTCVAAALIGVAVLTLVIWRFRRGKNASNEIRS